MSMSILDDYCSERCDIYVCQHVIEKLSISRVVHPVGQGAFYSERIFLGGNSSRPLNIVYDCGGNTSYRAKGGKCIIQVEVEDYYSPNSIIDLLFISHFDNDHVNGIKSLKDHCKIKRVVMPLLSNVSKCIYLSQLDENLRQLMINPREYLGDDVEIIWLDTMDINGDYNDADVVRLGDELSPTKERIIKSGALLQLEPFDKWCYIPFNFDEEYRNAKLLGELQSNNSHLDISKIKAGDVEYILSKRKIINDAYKKLVKNNGSSNESSLIVYSGPTTTKHSFVKKNNVHYDKLLYSSIVGPGRLRSSARCMPYHVACLYLGDTCLNQKSGSVGIVEALCKYLGDVKDNIGLVQIPHHGSYWNYNADILYAFNPYKHYFASFGRRNKYAHPSSVVVESIERNNVFFGVTEDRGNIFIESITEQV